MERSRYNNIDVFIIFFLFLLLSIIYGDEQEQTVGLFLNDSASYNGYTLFTPKASTSTYLINNQGMLIHQWISEFKPTMTAYILENGDLLRASRITTGEVQGGGFQILSWDSELLWEYKSVYQHHDIEPLPNGNVLLILNDSRTKDEVIELGGNSENLASSIRGLKIIEVENDGNGSGNIVWEWSIWDHLVQDFDSTKINYATISDHPELFDVNYMQMKSPDWLHTNGIDYNEELDQIVISNRNINEIWIIDHSITTEESSTHSGGKYGKGGDIIYRWGNPASYKLGTIDDQKLFGQHDAHWIKPGLTGEGNMLIYNNGMMRQDSSYSSIDEIVLPITNEGKYSLQAGNKFMPDNSIWTYFLEPEYFSGRYSSAQRLPNGNTLICSGDKGIFFEINSRNDIVWKYINPVNNEGAIVQGEIPKYNSTGRCYRYSKDFLGFDGKELTPGKQIELYENVSIVEDKVEKVSEFKLSNAYPNPFNPSTTIEFSIPKENFVNITIYDLKGNVVDQLVNENKSGGNYKINWNAENYPSGVYLYKINAGNFSNIKKCILVK